MPLLLEYHLNRVTCGALLIIDSKVRGIQRILDLLDDAQNSPPKNRVMLDLGVACGELIAIIKAATPHQGWMQSLNSTTAALAEARGLLRRAHDHLATYAIREETPEAAPLSDDTSKQWWRVSPRQIEIDWSELGLPDYVTTD